MATTPDEGKRVLDELRETLEQVVREQEKAIELVRTITAEVQALTADLA